MPLHHLVSIPSEESEATKRQYLEPLGAVLVSNSYLRIAVVCLTSVVAVLVFLDVRARLHTATPLIIRIDEIGHAEAVSFSSLQYQPREAEIRYFLMDFVQGYYGRMRATVRESYSHSLYYLDGRLADATIEQGKKNKSIEAFLAGQGQEIDIKIRNVSIEDLRTPPYRATVEFEKVFLASDRESKRERYVAHFVFVIKDRVSNELVRVNPLGLAITYFREDQAFE